MLYFSWEDFEFEYKPKTKEWYTGLIIITVAAIIGAVFLRNLLFGVLAVIAVFVVLLSNAKRPGRIKFFITDDGISAGEHFYSFDAIRSFALREGRGGYKLVLMPEERFTPYVVLPLPDDEVEDIRAYLRNELTETEDERTMIDAITEHIGL